MGLTSAGPLGGARRCPLCGHDVPSRVLTEERLDEEAVSEFTFSSRKEPDSMRYRMVVCSNCDLAYANPVLDIAWLRRNYVNASFKSSEESKQAANDHSRLLDQVLSRLPDRDRALDIGAGDGAFIEVLLQRGFSNVEGVEPSLEPIRKASNEAKDLIMQGFFHSENHEPSSYSIVTCFQTTEHVDNIASLARSIYRILKPGGCFLISAHDFRAWTARLLGSRSPIFDIEHLQLFSRESLRYLYSSSGFTEVEIRGMTNRYPVRYWLKLSPLPTALKKFAGRVITRFNLDQLHIPFHAGNLWAFGVKPK